MTAPRPTLDDVGRRAGVSAATVSYVLNGRTRLVGADTADRVRAAAAELSYRPNRAARALSTRRHGILGMVLGRVPHTPPATAAMTGAHDAARAHGHSLLVTSADASRAGLSAAVSELVDRQVDAIVVAVAGTRRLLLPDVPPDLPLLMVNCFGGAPGARCVLPDERSGGQAAATHLTELGHRRIGFAAGVRSMWATRARLRGVRAALAAAGSTLDEDLLRFGTYRIGSGHALARELLARPDRPTALLCGNDRMALGALLAAAELGLRVPQDVSVMGYDDEPELAAEAVPALSTVRLPYEAMGRWAVERLLDPSSLPALPPRTVLPCDLVGRSSVGPPPAAR